MRISMRFVSIVIAVLCFFLLSATGYGQVLDADVCKCASRSAFMFYPFLSDSIEIEPLSFDSNFVEIRLAELLDAEPGEYTRYSSSEHPGFRLYPKPLEYYAFDAEPDLILIDCYLGLWNPEDSTDVSIMPPIGHVTFGYIRSSDRFYVLTDNFSFSLEEEFTRMNRENFGTPDLPPVCIAALLVKLKCRGRNLAVIGNWSEAKTWILATEDNALWIGEEAGRRFILFPHCEEYFKDTTTVSFDVTAEGRYIKFLDALKDSITISPPTLTEYGDTIAVNLSTIAGYYYFGFAQWRVVFTRLGQVMSCEQTRKPVFIYDGGITDDESIIPKPAIL